MTIDWMLRTCAENGKSSHGFTYPTAGAVEAPDWDPNPNRACGGGLHGLPRGEGNWSLLRHDEPIRWQIIFYDPADGVVHSDKKIRIRKGTVETVPGEDLWDRLRDLRGNLKFQGDIDLSGTGITALPEGLHVGGELDLRGTGITALPEGLHVGGGLYLRGTGITALPEGLHVGGGLDLSGTQIDGQYIVKRSRVVKVKWNRLNGDTP